MKFHQKYYFILVFILSCSLAQYIDYLVFINIPEHEAISVFSFLELRHIRNHGGVFGIMQGTGWFFTSFAIVIMSILFTYLLTRKDVHLYQYICYGFIAGGAVSNILDRFIYGSVIDYFNVIGIPYWHYIFNTADSLIHVGIWPMLIMEIRQSRMQKKQDSQNKT